MAVLEMNAATYNNVGFKYGKQSDLRSVMTERRVVPGTFYLTSDTNRLYIGKSEDLIAPVNEGVIKVATINDLPKDTSDKDTGIIGSFYYVEDGNILCVFDGKKWVQINPDTTVTTEKVDVNVSAVTAGTQTNSEKIAITTVVTDTNGDGVSGSFVLGTNSVDAKQTIDLNVQNTGTEDAPLYNVTLTGDTYEVGTSVVNNANEVAVNLTSDFGHDSTVNFSSNGSVKFSADGSTITLSGFKAIDGTSLVNDTAESTTGFTIGLVDHNGDKAQANINPQIVVGKETAAQETVTFTNSVATLPVYTADEIDTKVSNLNTNFNNLIKGYNALEYKGTIGSNSDATLEALPDGSSEGQKVSIGYAYLASSDITVNGLPAPKGTLIIATAKDGATEDSNGYLAPTDIVWTTVTGDSADTHYGFAGEAGFMGVKLMDTTRSEEAGSFQLINSDLVEGQQAGLEITRSSASTDSGIILNIGHKDVTTTGSADGVASVMGALATDFTITYVSELVADGHGHITGYKTKTATIKDTTYDYKVDEASLTVAAQGDNGVTLTPVFSMTNTVTSDAYTPEKAEGITLNSSTLDIKVDENNTKAVAINLLWSTF